MVGGHLCRRILVVKDVDDDDELNINPPTPCQIGKRPPAPKPKRESAGHQGVAGGGYASLKMLATTCRFPRRSTTDARTSLRMHSTITKPAHSDRPDERATSTDASRTVCSTVADTPVPNTRVSWWAVFGAWCCGVALLARSRGSWPIHQEKFPESPVDFHSRSELNGGFWGWLLAEAASTAPVPL